MQQQQHQHQQQQQSDQLEVAGDEEVQRVDVSDSGIWVGAVCLDDEGGVLLVQDPPGSGVWNLPQGPLHPSQGLQQRATAAAIVQDLTGVDVTGCLTPEVLEAEAPPGSGRLARLFLGFSCPHGPTALPHGLALGVMQNGVDGTADTESPAPPAAAWFPLQQLLKGELDDAQLAAFEVSPFVPLLQAWVDRQQGNAPTQPEALPNRNHEAAVQPEPPVYAAAAQAQPRASSSPEPTTAALDASPSNQKPSLPEPPTEPEREPPASPDPAADPALEALLTYRAQDWRGPTPKDYLSDWCAWHRLAQPCYNVFDHKARRRFAYCATCILCHQGAQITPRRGFATPGQAEENAALAAIVFMAGGFDGRARKHCDIGPVGFIPVVKGIVIDTPPLPAISTLALLQSPGAAAADGEEEEREEAAEKKPASQADASAVLAERAAALRTEQEQLLRDFQERSAAFQAELDALRQLQQQAVAGGREQAAAIVSVLQGQMEAHAQQPPPKKQKVAKALVTEGKPPVQILKEVCDKYRWVQPVYEYIASDDGHQCRMTHPQAAPGGTLSQPQPNQKLAKTEVAQIALTLLHSQNLYDG